MTTETEPKLDFLKFCRHSIHPKYRVSKKVFGEGIVVKNGVFTITIFQNKEGGISLSYKRQFSGWYMFGWLTSFLLLNILGAGIYLLIFRGSNQEMAAFYNEIKASLNNPEI